MSDIDTALCLNLDFQTEVRVQQHPGGTLIVFGHWFGVVHIALSSFTLQPFRRGRESMLHFFFMFLLFCVCRYCLLYVGRQTGRQTGR